MGSLSTKLDTEHDIAHPASEFDARRFSHNYPPGIENYFWSLARTELVRRFLDEAASEGYRRRHGRVLEVGAELGSS
jgi:hypothetical protein